MGASLRRDPLRHATSRVGSGVVLTGGRAVGVAAGFGVVAAVVDKDTLIEDAIMSDTVVGVIADTSNMAEAVGVRATLALSKGVDNPVMALPADVKLFAELPADVSSML